MSQLITPPSKLHIFSLMGVLLFSLSGARVLQNFSATTQSSETRRSLIDADFGKCDRQGDTWICEIERKLADTDRKIIQKVTVQKSSPRVGPHHTTKTRYTSYVQLEGSDCQGDCTKPQLLSISDQATNFQDILKNLKTKVNEKFTELTAPVVAEGSDDPAATGTGTAVSDAADDSEQMSASAECEKLESESKERIECEGKVLASLKSEEEIREHYDNNLKTDLEEMLKSDDLDKVKKAKELAEALIKKLGTKVATQSVRDDLKKMITFSKQLIEIGKKEDELEKEKKKKNPNEEKITRLENEISTKKQLADYDFEDGREKEFLRPLDSPSRLGWMQLMHAQMIRQTERERAARAEIVALRRQLLEAQLQLTQTMTTEPGQNSVLDNNSIWNGTGQGQAGARDSVQQNSGAPVTSIIIPTEPQAAANTAPAAVEPAAQASAPVGQRPRRGNL